MAERLAPVDPGSFEVEVRWVPASGAAQMRTVRLAPGASLDDAVSRSGLDLPDNSWREPGGQLRLAVFGVLIPAGALAQPGDCIDITRPLTVDAKDARRARARQAAARRRARQARCRPSCR